MEGDTDVESAEILEARRVREREAERRRDAAKLAAGLCLDCGGPGRCAGNPRYCAECWERRQERTRQWNAKVKAKRAAEGKSRQEPCEVRCPDCKGVCIRAGVSHSGRQTYKCKKCGYQHHGAREQFPLPEGAEVYSVVLQLNQKSVWGLEGYAAKHGIPENHALRLILRAAAVDPPYPMAAGTWDTTYGGQRVWRAIKPKPDKPIPMTGPFKFRNVNAEVARARMQRGGEERFRPQILVVRRLAVKLDGLAVAGIIKIMRAFNLHHQDAVRLILERVWRGLGV